MNILAILRDSAGTGKADQTHLIIQEGPWHKSRGVQKRIDGKTRYFVKKASAGTEGVGQTQLCITTRLPAFFSLSSRFAVRNLLTDHAHVPDFFHTFP